MNLLELALDLALVAVLDLDSMGSQKDFRAFSDVRMQGGWLPRSCAALWSHFAENP